MKRMMALTVLALSATSMAACSNDKPATDASSSSVVERNTTPSATSSDPSAWRTNGGNALPSSSASASSSSSTSMSDDELASAYASQWKLTDATPRGGRVQIDTSDPTKFADSIFKTYYTVDTVSDSTDGAGAYRARDHLSGMNVESGSAPSRLFTQALEHKAYSTVIVSAPTAGQSEVFSETSRNVCRDVMVTWHGEGNWTSTNKGTACAVLERDGDHWKATSVTTAGGEL